MAKPKKKIEEGKVEKKKTKEEGKPTSSSMEEETPQGTPQEVEQREKLAKLILQAQTKSATTDLLSNFSPLFDNKDQESSFQFCLKPTAQSTCHVSLKGIKVSSQGYIFVLFPGQKYLQSVLLKETRITK